MKKLVVMMVMVVAVMMAVMSGKVNAEETITFTGSTCDCIRKYSEFWAENYNSELAGTRIYNDDGSIDVYQIFYVDEEGDDVVVANIEWNDFMIFLDDLDDYLTYNYYECYTGMLDFMGVWYF